MGQTSKKTQKGEAKLPRTPSSVVFTLSPEASMTRLGFAGSSNKPSRVIGRLLVESGRKQIF
jgi:membrane-bound lytic murein transglycosylase